MEEQFKVQYETVGASSYMTVTCPPDAPLVHFQLEMIFSNEIRNFLPVTRQVIDGQTILYYNITSRIPLTDVLEKRKLTRKELKNLLEGAILAIHESREFRLSEEGLRMEPEWIFVSPGSCDPAFVFIPAAPKKECGLKELLKDLVYKDQIEMVNDNLIQILLRELSGDTFSADRLENSLKAYYGTAAAQNGGAFGQLTQREPRQEADRPQDPAWQPPYGQAQPYQSFYGQKPFYGQQPPYQQPYGQESQSQEPLQTPDSSFAGALMGQKAVPADSAQPEEGAKKKNPKVPKKFPKAPKAPKAPRTSEEESRGKKADAAAGEFDRDKAKKKFLLPQAVILVALSAAISFGLFQNAQGQLQFDVIGAAVLIIAVAEVIIYREAYVNGRKNPKGTDAKKKEKNPAGARPAPPKPSVSPAASRPPVSLAPAQPPVPPTAPGPSVSPAPAQPPVPPTAPRSLVSPPAAPRPSVPPAPMSQPLVPPTAAYGWENAGSGDETELWNGAMENGQDAYLEYFENGRITRIPLSPSRALVVGRLRSEVDFAVKSPRVGKIHAKFFYQTGQYYVTDINSKNGTYINGSGRRIESNVPWPLQDKDRIMLADCEFTIRCAEG